ncbi:MAG: PqqD family protein [Deltaproteobacteria bacterium]
MVELLPLFPAQKAGVASRVLGGVAVAITEADQTLHTFENDVATEIWTLADGSRSVEQIVQRIVDGYEVERPRAEADVAAFMEVLVQKGLIELRGQPA